MWTVNCVWPLTRLMILYNTFIIIMSSKQPYLNTFTYNKTIRLTWCVFMLKFCYLHDTNDPTNKTETDTWKLKMHSTELNPMCQRCRFKNGVQKWGCKIFWKSAKPSFPRGLCRARKFTFAPPHRNWPRSSRQKKKMHGVTGFLMTR